MRPTITRKTRRTLAALVLVGATGISTATAVAQSPARPSKTGAEQRGQHETARGFYDVRRGSGSAARQAEFRTTAKAAARPATKALRRSLGDTALVDIDGTTGTPRMVAKLDGYLTPASSASPKSVALGYVGDNLAGFGLASEDLATFKFRDDYTDVAGIHHLSWSQTISGIPIFGYGLQASVNKKGRLLTIGGSPVPSALITPRPAPARLSATDALRAARRDAGETALRPGPRDTASQVLVVTRKATYLGWQTITMSSSRPALSVRDAASGRLLYRRPLAQDETSEPLARKPKPSTGVAFEYFPKAPHGGGYIPVNYTKKGWLSAGASKLSGNNSHAYSDVNDSNSPQKSEEVGPKSGTPGATSSSRSTWAASPSATTRSPARGTPTCRSPGRRTGPRTPPRSSSSSTTSTTTCSRPRSGSPRTPATSRPRTPPARARARTPWPRRPLDGANTAGGLPDGGHIDNANMSTPPDGHAPTMQMYLQHEPFTTYPDGDPFPANNTGDEGDTVYHEYTHGLSNRLVIDPNGVSSLGRRPGGRDGRGVERLVRVRLPGQEGPAHRQARQGRRPAGHLRRRRPGPGPHGGRWTASSARRPAPTAPAATPVTPAATPTPTTPRSAVVPRCTPTARSGARPSGTCAASSARPPPTSLVTRAMELAPYNPSFLDMRNAILIADTAVFGGSHQADIWDVFADRGMGYFAGSLGGDDAAPAADFEVPPATPVMGTITGTVTDQDSGDPVSGVPVTLAFQGGNTTANPTAITAVDGTYTLGPVPVGEYGKLVVNGSGYDVTSSPVTVDAGGTTADFEVRRDWAAASGGGCGDRLRRARLLRLRLWAERGDRRLAGHRLEQHHRRRRGTDQRDGAEGDRHRAAADGRRHRARGGPGGDVR